MAKRLIAALGFLFASLSPGMETLTNGTPFFGVQEATLARDSLGFSFQGGPAVLSAEQQGIILILREAFKEGPAGRSLAEVKQELFDLGAEIEYAANANAFEARVKSPPAALDQVLALAKQTWQSPRVEKADFQRFHGTVLAGLKSRFEDMNYILNYFVPRDLLAYSPQTRTGETTPASFQKISYDDFRKALPLVIDFRSWFVTYAGPEAIAAVKAKISTAFEPLLTQPYARYAVTKPPVPLVAVTRYTIVDKPGATDNQVGFAYPRAVSRDTEAWPVAKTTLDILGGGLHGRLNQVLRVQRGLTYDASAYFADQLPYWQVSTFGGLQQTDPLVRGVPEVVKKFTLTAVTSRELAEAKERLLNGRKMAVELPEDLIRGKGHFYANGLDVGFVDRYPALLASVSLKNLNAFRSSLGAKAVAIYLVGDKEKLKAILKAQGVADTAVTVVTLAEMK